MPRTAGKPVPFIDEQNQPAHKARPLRNTCGQRMCNFSAALRQTLRLLDFGAICAVPEARTSTLLTASAGLDYGRENHFRR